MRKLAIVLLASAAMSAPAFVPALAQQSGNQKPPAGQATQASQAQNKQQSQAQQTSQQHVYNNAGNQQPANQTASTQASQQQPISPHSLSRNEIRQVQIALNKDGFGAGSVDGRWGPKTRDAVRNFQQMKHLQATGELSSKTISDLGLNQAQFAKQQNQQNMNAPGTAKTH